ncbi:hypothetical protein [Anianabacter salinae]|uniref:hypothetical protein n=1 Tax=Anianabacter salinae TaxID=2851023 RepID=UPI00225E623C|nr:hypothetical protein [Anianabacter salinae]MBV0913306.1 hypothetical protein [Anianabacter salinae]
MSEDEDMVAVNLKRERSPSFPYLDLEACIDLMKILYAAARMNGVRQSDAAVAWDMAPKSGSLLRYVAALGQFGLIETIGSGDQRRLKISATGRRILEDDRPGVREALKSEAALKPTIVRGLYFGEGDMPAWGKDRPSDNIAESSLKFDMGFGSEAARRFLTVYDATIKCVIDNGDVKGPIHSGDGEALESDDIEPEADAELMLAKPPLALQTPPPEVASEATLNVIDFQNAGKGKIRISAVLDAEGLDMLEKKIAAFRMLIN